MRAEHEHALDRRGFGERLVGDVLERHDRAAPPRAVAGDEHLGLRVVDAVAQGLRAEAAEHDRVRRADARAGEHGRDRLGNHPHVDRDAVALLDAERPQRVGDATGLLEQVLVRDRAGVARLAFPVERDLIAVPGFYVAVEAVVRDVELPADEPFGERKLPFEDGLPLLRPVELQRLRGPEPLPVAFGLVVDRRVGVERGLAKVGRWRERAAFIQQSFERVRHARSPLRRMRRRLPTSKLDHAMRAESRGVGERARFRDSAAAGQRFEVTDVRAFLPGAAARFDERLDPEAAEPLRLRLIGNERAARRAAPRAGAAHARRRR